MFHIAVGASLWIPIYILFANLKQYTITGGIMTSGLVLIVVCGVRNTIHNKYIISLVMYRLLVLVCGHSHCQEKTHSVKLGVMQK